MPKMRLTRHNGRAGKHGTYSPKHNDRNFDVSNSEHINAERSKDNIYWDCFNGIRTVAARDHPDEEVLAETFVEVEELFYAKQYRANEIGQHQRNAKNGHSERNRSTSDVLKDKRYCPEETLYQIGDMEHHASPEVLLQVVTDFMAEMERRFGSLVHVLDWALHLDEATPHIHERHVFDCENQYGELFPQQEKALEKLGFDLPDPTKKQGKHNNRKMTFDAACRTLLFDIAKKHGLDLEEEPAYGGRAYLEKQDFILAKQKEQMEVQEQKLEELTLKIEDVETLIDEVTDIAYDKAVEVVTDTVRVETHKEDIRLIEETKTWLQSPERKAPKKERDYAISRLDGVIGKIKNAMQSALDKIKSALLSPEVKKSSKEQIKEQVKPSVLAKLTRNKELEKQENEVRRNEHRPHKKQDMER